MRWRQVVGLWVLFAALAAEYLLVERRRPPPPSAEAARPARPRFVDLRPDDVRELRLERRGRTIVSRVADGHWTVIEPPGATIPGDLLEAFTVALAGAEEIERLPDRGDGRAFGLDEGAARVEMRGAAGPPVVVNLGGPNPTGTAIYARRDQAADVVLIGRNVGYYEEMIFQALPAPRVPAGDENVPVG